MPKATLVMIEPLGEDDWEVLELNSEHAEASTLKQAEMELNRGAAVLKGDFSSRFE
ncbi:hypothetical protein SAY86_017290 [Trapa natans]|uniref:Peroxisomal ATPase PEX1 N-terminal C-lobe domain-containing protein n=1 Tax=Trapa natans TaxID=22666 RepID=A0AAN7LP18_TRANT|nr:hypothetical protein SAY86_017290 [Trapa natans]